MLNSLQKATEVYILANGMPSEDLELLGDSDNGIYTDALDIDATAILDCSTLPGVCLSKHFVYDAYCQSSYCYVRARRFLKEDTSDRNSHYVLRLIRGGSNWVRQCVVYGDLGSQICSSLEAQGWEKI